MRMSYVSVRVNSLPISCQSNIIHNRLLSRFVGLTKRKLKYTIIFEDIFWFVWLSLYVNFAVNLRLFDFCTQISKSLASIGIWMPSLFRRKRKWQQRETKKPWHWRHELFLLMSIRRGYYTHQLQWQVFLHCYLFVCSMGPVGFGIDRTQATYLSIFIVLYSFSNSYKPAEHFHATAF